MSAPTALKEMSDEALAAEDKRLDSNLREAREQLRAVRREREARESVRQAQRQVAKMNPKERAALLQALGVKSVPSAEAVGTPGAGSTTPEG